MTDNEDFLTELPPTPEDEFCVYGTVLLTFDPDPTYAHMILI